MTLLVSTQACGESGQSTATLAPLIDELPTTTTSATLTAEDIAAAGDAWKRTSALFTEPFTREPFESDNGLYVLAQLADLKPTDATSSFLTMVLLAWEDPTWMPIQQFDPNCPNYCDLSLFGEGLLKTPIIVISWCCPMGAAPLELPETILLQVVDGQLIDYSNPSASSSEFTVQYVTIDSDSQFTIVECLESSVYEIPDIGPNGICNHLVEKTYRFAPDGSPTIETSEMFAKTPINECLIDPPVGCQQEVYIEPSDACPDPARNDSRFPIRPCQYGTWMLYFEQSISDLGYAVNADGYYDSTEVSVIKQLQRDFALDPDGLIGPRTWGAAQPFSICAPEDLSLGLPGPCSEDGNGDGVYGPGDIVPH